MIFELSRVIAVVVLLVAAGILATAPGRLPLALRGIRRIMGKDSGIEDPSEPKAPLWRRLLSFLLVLAAGAIALLK
jgi:hypothetical protein